MPLDSQGLQLAALNCSGNPIHPNPDLACKAAEVTRKTLELAGLLGVETIVCMTGCPGTPQGGGYPNWVVASWPEDFLELLDWQWRERVIPYWSEIAELAKSQGVRQLCFELHPGMSAYNVTSFNRICSPASLCVISSGPIALWGLATEHNSGPTSSPRCDPSATIGCSRSSMKIR